MQEDKIIHSLRICANDNALCTVCVFNKDENCRILLAKEALGIINRQQAVIERYEKEHNEKFKVWELLDKRTKERYAKLYEEAISVVRAEAIEAFADKVKENRVTLFNYIYSSMGFGKQIDNLVKEMAGNTE